MITATLLLSICQIGMALAGGWWWLVALRSAEGLLLPAPVTSIMTYVASSTARDQVRQALAWCVSTTIFGGFSGRALSGLIAANYDWSVALGVWVRLLIAMAVAVARLPVAGRSHFGKVTPRAFIEVLAEPGLRHGYLAILWAFFVFAGLLNVLPFRLSALDPAITATGIGFAYAGYLSDILVSLGAQRNTQRSRLGTEGGTLGLGIGLYSLGLTLVGLPSVSGLYLAMFAFCGGMFLIHTRLSGRINHLSERHQGVVNGIYIAAYYLAAASAPGCRR